MKQVIKSEDRATYGAGGETGFTAAEREVIERYKVALKQAAIGEEIDGSVAAKRVLGEYLSAHNVGREEEAFTVIYLNNQHRVITIAEEFQGTHNQCAVYPRVIARRALQHNAAAVILAHNHPSGDPTPSNADRAITRQIRDALELIDTQVLDHLIVGHRILSMVEEGGAW